MVSRIGKLLDKAEESGTGTLVKGRTVGSDSVVCSVI